MRLKDDKLCCLAIPRNVHTLFIVLFALFTRFHTFITCFFLANVVCLVYSGEAID